MWILKISFGCDDPERGVVAMYEGRLMEPKHAQPNATSVLLNPLTIWRCPKCGTMLAKLRLTPGSLVEIKCAKCNTLVKEAA